jgi:PTS system nitrogen regulatory IIA component
MTLEDFARHVGLRTDEVRRLADRGKLPGHKVGGQWRFNRAQVTEWLQQEIPTYAQDRLLEIENAMGRTDGEVPDESSLIVTDLIGLEGIEVLLPANTKASVLRELVKLAERTGLLYDADGLHEAIVQREDLCSTALPNKVAIPHPRQPMPYVSAEPLICAARSLRGIPFGSSYGGLTTLFFLICCHDDRHHLRVLARLMRILEGGMVETLMGVETREEFLEAMIAKERLVVAQAK